MSFAARTGRYRETSRKDTVTEAKTQALEVPGAVLRYDIRDAEVESTSPVLLMIGSPMDASGFTTLVDHFRDRTVVTYDPRGVGRSERTDGAEASTPEQHADDLNRLISALGAGPVDIFASSGGAVNGLALVARHPEQVRTLVAHEPPAAQVLPDREDALAAVVDIHETYKREGIGAGMGKFIAVTSLKGPIPADFADQSPPNPADFGLPTEDNGTRDDPLLGQNIISGTHFEHDFDALRAASTRIAVAAGAESEGQMTYRAAVAVAERLGTEPVIFPSHHAGFLGGEFGMNGDPDAFAVTLRQVLAEDGSSQPETPGRVSPSSGS
jgi:pimeloyl-ACP methyl ester carboxylesterase